MYTKAISSDRSATEEISIWWLDMIKTCHLALKHTKKEGKRKEKMVNLKENSCNRSSSPNSLCLIWVAGAGGWRCSVFCRERKYMLLSSNYKVFSSSFNIPPQQNQNNEKNYLHLFSGFVFPEVKTKRKGDKCLCRVSFPRA